MRNEADTTPTSLQLLSSTKKYYQLQKKAWPNWKEHRNPRRNKSIFSKVGKFCILLLNFPAYCYLISAETKSSASQNRQSIENEEEFSWYPPNTLQLSPWHVTTKITAFLTTENETLFTFTIKAVSLRRGINGHNPKQHREPRTQASIHSAEHQHAHLFTHFQLFTPNWVQHHWFLHSCVNAALLDLLWAPILR